MDGRIREHAETLVGWSARIERGDDVVVAVGDGAHDLAVAVAAELGDRGANPVLTYESDEVLRAYLGTHDGDFDADPSHALSLVESADAYLALRGSRNTAAMADVAGARQGAYDRARSGIREARLATDWVSTIHPTRALAQAAGMPIEAYRDFAYGAINRDWASLADEMAALKDVLDEGRELRIRTERSDVSLPIEHRVAVNSAASVAYGSHNLPSGEVFTAPAGADGEVTFDLPALVNGRRVRDVWLRFEDGVVVDHAAAEGADAVASVLDTDPGARRVGEVGIGMNRGIDRITDSVIFDEKMAGTVHLALGRAYDECIPAGESGNRSAIHVDLLIDMREGSALTVDGRTIQRDGVFRWEDDFPD